jgi:hypothetical protein
VTTKPGELSIVSVEGGVDVTKTTGGSFDFGQVAMGTKATLKVRVKNSGSGHLALTTLSKTAGDAVKVGANGEPNPFFIADYTAADLGPGEQLEIPVTFDSQLDQPSMIVAHAATLQLSATNTVAGHESVVIDLKATSVSGECELPAELAFGSVTRGDSASLSMELKNTRLTDGVAFIGPITSNSGDDTSFSFSVDSPTGTFGLKAGASRTISIAFSPTQIKDYLARVTMRRLDSCPDKVVKLTGIGVDAVLSWAPATIDFGYVTPGATGNGELTFTNLGQKAVAVTMLKATVADYKVVTPEPVTVPPNGTAKVALTFKPGVLGPRNGQLDFKTDLLKQPAGSVALKGAGGGPDIDVRPTVLSFGKVAYFAGLNPPGSVNRKLAVLNVGTKPPMPDSKANLHLGVGAAAPWASILPANAATQASELDVSLNPLTPYDGLTGLPAQAGKNLIELVVTLTPQSVGMKAATVTIHSDDYDEPDVTVTVTADVIALPPCKYAISPAALDFGVVSPPGFKQQSFVITNLSQTAGDLCLVSDVRTPIGSDAIFSLPGGPITEKQLQPGESMRVDVRAWPQTLGTTPVTTAQGSVELFISSDTKPTGKVPLAATIASSCVTIAPSSADFGAVKLGCSSATRTFSVYNACGGPVTISSLSMLVPAGQPAGGPACPGTNACPEFGITQSPPVPLTLGAGATPISFQVKYQPIDLGHDTGAVGLTIDSGSGPQLHLVTLDGEGTTLGTNTDIFTQGAVPKADILLVIDGSCSMASKQQLLAMNTTSFFTTAQSDGVDYHMGIIDGQGAGSNPPVGQFTSGPTHPDKVLTPLTPNVLAQFQAKVVAIGANGADEECFGPALKALTSPLLTTTNAGFLRTDASLAIVCITDDIDHSVGTAAYFYSALLNVKGAKTSFSVSAIAPFLTTSPCGASALDNGRYSDMVSLSGGVKEEICTPDWAASLRQISKASFGARGTFYLGTPPDLSSNPVVVKIDGAVVGDVMGGQTIWTYDPIDNAVTFSPNYLPGPGSRVEISYDVACF